jgi:dsRNA-specific ribonuclease
MVDLFIEKLNLLKFFPTVDRDLVQLAITEETRKTSKDTELLISRLEKRYSVREGTPNQRSLAFYGDSLLDMIIVDRIKYLYNINIDPDNMTFIRQEMASNESLLIFSRQLNICHDVFGISNSKSFKDLGSHNVCGDSIEAILGVLFIQFGMASFYRIEEWFFSLKPFADYFEEITYDVFQGRQEKLKLTRYIPTLRLEKWKDLDVFLNKYLNENVELIQEPSYNNKYAYYIYTLIYDRKFYLATLDKDDKQGLKDALISRGIWKW